MFSYRFRSSLVALAAIMSLALPAGSAFARAMVDPRLNTVAGREAYVAMKDAQLDRAEQSSMRIRDRARTAKSVKNFKAVESYAQFKARQMERLLK